MRIVARVLILIAYTFAIYLAMVSLSSGTIAGCGGGSPCDKILKSEWAYIGSIPVSIPAAMAYGMLLILPAVKLVRSGWGNVLQLGLCASIVLAVLWFVGIQVFVLGQICPFCMASHLFGAAGAILYALDLRNRAERSDGNKPMMHGVVVGAVATVSFIVLQFLLPQPDRSAEYTVDTKRIVAQETPVVPEETKEIPSNEKTATTELERVIQLESPPGVVEVWLDDSDAGPEEVEKGIPQAEPVGAEPAVAEPEPVEEVVPVYSIHDGKFNFPVNEIPGIGNWRAPNLMLNLIDFACDHCREHYRVMRKRAPWYEEEIFFGVMPLALNVRCNPYFTMTELPDYANCEYARLALAVWRMAPDKYLEYVDWLCMESSPPASLEKSQWPIAKQHAENLIGEDLLNQGWEDPWVVGMMDTLTELYGYNLKLTGQADIPQQFLNQTLRFGSITRESQFDMTMGMSFPIEIKKRR